VIATSSNTEGDATALYLIKVLKPLGVTFEDKGAGLVFHYRTLPNREEVKRSILKEIGRSRAAQGFSIDHARAVIELRPPLDINKGAVMKEVIEDNHLAAAVYMGDDVSDMDAFALSQPFQLFLPFSKLSLNKLTGSLFF